MERKKYFELGGLGATLGAFVSATPTLIAIPGPALIADAVKYFGIGIGTCGLLLVMIPFLPSLAFIEPTVRRAKRNDLRIAYEFCQGMFGDNFATYNSVKRWFNHNDKMFWIVEKVRKSAAATVSEIRGFYSILPLTQAGEKALLDGEIDGRGFLIDHIAKNVESSVALYVGVIASKGIRFRGAALGSLITNITSILERKSCRIYTRPTTSDGLRIAKQRGFEAVDGSGTEQLDKLYVHDGRDL
ncbi:MAG: hypothetical protein NFW04_15500 [Candidatus Accumulibacter sp.]|uniref:hypothetical protein n=1 Tax=Accumulibacter sp. TaxID=2053492 RepID=UPI0025F394D7|nr:hypothetical protein [Accumulibacter sp.]MCM8600037.1 hypothetical protein [Accumulibacter sp.]